MCSVMRYRNGLALVVVSIIACVAISSCGIVKTAQLPRVVNNREFHRNYPRLEASQIDSLLHIYGGSKTFVIKFLEPTLIALSHYPELEDVEIEFKYSSEATTMAARPKTTSIFGKRKYLVLINSDDDFGGVSLEKTPFNAQIGIIGHELAHIADYENRNFMGLMGVLMRYSSKGHKPLFEKEIDRATIERGLGWQLYDWAEYSMSEDSGVTDDYRDFKRRNYLSSDEIEEQIEFFSRYGKIR